MEITLSALLLNNLHRLAYAMHQKNICLFRFHEIIFPSLKADPVSVLPSLCVFFFLSHLSPFEGWNYFYGNGT